MEISESPPASIGANAVAYAFAQASLSVECRPPRFSGMFGLGVEGGLQDRRFRGRDGFGRWLEQCDEGSIVGFVMMVGCDRVGERLAGRRETFTRSENLWGFSIEQAGAPRYL